MKLLRKVLNTYIFVMPFIEKVADLKSVIRFELRLEKLRSRELRAYEGIVVDTELAKSFGFTGKASISPRHVEVINQVFSPTMAEIEYAYEVVDAIENAKRMGKGAISLRGKMIDAPIVARAERTISMAKALGLDRRVDNE